MPPSNLLNNLQNVLQDLARRNPQVPQAVLNQIVRAASRKAANEPPPRVAFIGETGVGKSTTLNVLFGTNQGVSHTQAHTQFEEKLEVTIEEILGSNGSLIVYDMPGVGESINKSDQHRETYERVLSDVDVAIWILEAHNRSIEFVQIYLRDEISKINPRLTSKMVFALNKADLVSPGQNAWIKVANLPSEEQERNILLRCQDVSRKVKEALPYWEGEVVAYSAEMRYNLPALFSAILNAVPRNRRWIVASREAMADYFAMVDPGLLRTAPQLEERYTERPPTQSAVVDALNQVLELQARERRSAQLPSEPPPPPRNVQGLEPAVGMSKAELIRLLQQMDDESFAGSAFAAELKDLFTEQDQGKSKA